MSDDKIQQIAPEPEGSRRLVLERACRTLVSVTLAGTWVLTGAGPWITQRVLPSPDAIPRFWPHFQIVGAYTEAYVTFAGALSLLVFGACLWLACGKSWSQMSTQ